MATAKKPGSKTAAQKKAALKSLDEVRKAEKNLQLKIEKHHGVVSSMFFPG